MRILALLRQMTKQGILQRDPSKLIRNLVISENFSDLRDSQVVIESIIENLETKRVDNTHLSNLHRRGERANGIDFKVSI